MSIADKLLTIAENEQKVYEAGYNKGTEDGIAQGESTGYWQGYYGYYDEFWNACQNNGNRINYGRAFMGRSWNKDNFYPKYDIKGDDAAYFTFQWFNEEGVAFDLAERLEECGVVLDTSKSRFNDPFTGAVISRLPIIDSTGNTNTYCAPFTDCRQLVTVDKWILKDTPTTSFANAVRYCYELVNIVVEGVFGQSISFQYSSKLSNDSVQSIIDALYDWTGGTAQTLTFHATVKNQLTDEQKAQITSKNWTLA